MDSLDAVIDDAVAAQPTPNGDTGAQVRSELQALSTAAPAPVDTTTAAPPLVSRKGERYDAAVHMTPPQQTARGTWRKLPRGILPTLGDVAQATGPSAADAAHGTCELLFGSCAPMLDLVAPLPAMQWAPTEGERENIEHALKRFYERYPQYMTDLPPGVALVLAVGAYAMPRVWMLPQTKQLLARVTKRKKRAQQPSTDEAPAEAPPDVA